jgi:hypothetical protein
MHGFCNPPQMPLIHGRVGGPPGFDEYPNGHDELPDDPAGVCGNDPVAPSKETVNVAIGQ